MIPAACGFMIAAGTFAWIGAASVSMLFSRFGAKVSNAASISFGCVVFVAGTWIATKLTYKDLRWRYVEVEDTSRPSEDTSCPHCDYNLTGNVSGICPECGRPVHREPEAEDEASR